LKDSTKRKIPHYPYNDAIRLLNKQSNLEDLSQFDTNNDPKNNDNNNTHRITINKLTFKANYGMKFDVDNYVKEEKANNENINSNNLNKDYDNDININNNHNNQEESENYSPIGKLVSFQNFNGGSKISDADLNEEYNKFGSNKSKHEKGRNSKNVLNLQSNFNPDTDMDNSYKSSNDESIEEEINEYEEESDRSNRDYCIYLFI